MSVFAGLPFEWTWGVASPWVSVPEIGVENMSQDDVKQVKAVLEGYQQSTAHFQGAVEQQLKNMWGDIKENKEWAIRTDERLNNIEAKMLNGYSHRLETLESFASGCSDTYVRVDTFNQALSSLREQINHSEEKTAASLNQVLGQVKQFKWFLSLFATMFLALVGWMVIS